MKPRQIAMYLIRTLTPHSLSEIGEYFGGRDHTTVLHAFHKIENDVLLDKNGGLKKTLYELKEMLKTGP